jgi:hypothetical protein
VADKDTLKGILHGVGKRTPEPELLIAEEEIETPQDVGPCGMVSVKGCKALDVERNAEPVLSFQMVYLGVVSEYTPTKFWVVFSGEKSWKVTVEGRNLRPLFDRLADHCLRRIRQAHRGDMLPDDGKPVVTRITVEEVKEKG